MPSVAENVGGFNIQGAVKLATQKWEANSKKRAVNLRGSRDTNSEKRAVKREGSMRDGGTFHPVTYEATRERKRSPFQIWKAVTGRLLVSLF